MRLFILSIFTVLLSSCATKHEIRNFNLHVFNDDTNFIERNLKCSSTYLTDEYDYVSNEIFRCSNKPGSVFLEVESDGNNSNDLKTVTLFWKDWHNDLNPEHTEVTARQYAAVFAKMYTRDKQIEFMDAFFNDIPTEFDSVIYKVKLTKSEKKFYDLRKAQVTFKKAKK